MKLSKAQERALSKMTNEWQTAAQVGESVASLRKLAKLGKLEEQFQPTGPMVWNRKTTQFRITQ